LSLLDPGRESFRLFPQKMGEPPMNWRNSTELAQLYNRLIVREAK
jgi:hypothetical protein